jgi:hypothetical protein
MQAMYFPLAVMDALDGKKHGSKTLAHAGYGRRPRPIVSGSPTYVRTGLLILGRSSDARCICALANHLHNQLDRVDCPVLYVHRELVEVQVSMRAYKLCSLTMFAASAMAPRAPASIPRAGGTTRVRLPIPANVIPRIRSTDGAM